MERAMIRKFFGGLNVDEAQFRQMLDLYFVPVEIIQDVPDIRRVLDQSRRAVSPFL